MAEPQPFTLEVEQVEGFEYRVKFDWPAAPDLTLDEPEPLGHEKGPNASRLVAAAVANCMTASLAFSLTRSRVEAGPMRATVTGTLTRNEKGRMRIGSMAVAIHLPEGLDTASSAVQRCLGMFEDYCVVTQSIRDGVPVEVTVVDAAGTEVHRGPVES